MELIPGIFHFNTGPFNWYVVQEASRLTLVDAGFPSHYAVFRAGLESIGRTPSDLEAIILTHNHADHTGFAKRLSSETGAPIYIHELDRAGLARPLNLPWYGLLTRSWRSHVRSMLIHATLNGVFTASTNRSPIVLQDGQRLDIPGKPEVIHVPGHTPGETAFFLPDRKTLFSGDTLVTLNLMTGAHGSPQLPDHLLNCDDRQACSSLDRLSDLGDVTILPGHGHAWKGDISEAIRLALQRST